MGPTSVALTILETELLALKRQLSEKEFVSTVFHFVLAVILKEDEATGPGTILALLVPRCLTEEQKKKVLALFTLVDSMQPYLRKQLTFIRKMTSNDHVSFVNQSAAVVRYASYAINQQTNIHLRYFMLDALVPDLISQWEANEVAKRAPHSSLRGFDRILQKLFHVWKKAEEQDVYLMKAAAVVSTTIPFMEGDDKFYETLCQLFTYWRKTEGRIVFLRQATMSVEIIASLSVGDMKDSIKLLSALVACGIFNKKEADLLPSYFSNHPSYFLKSATEEPPSELGLVELPPEAAVVEMTLMDLPDGNLALVVSFLPVKERFRLRAVHPTWREVILRGIEEISISSRRHRRAELRRCNHALDFAAKYLPNLKGICIMGCSRRNVLNFLQQAPSLLAVHFMGHIDEAFMSALNRQGNLHTLILYRCSFRSMEGLVSLLRPHQRSLVCLEIDNPFIGDVWDSDIDSDNDSIFIDGDSDSDSHSHSESESESESDSHSDSIFSDYTVSWPDQNKYVEVLSGMKSLKSLTFWNHRLNNDSIRLILKKQKQLLQLNLQGLTARPNGLLEIIGAECPPKLRNLSIDDVNAPTDAILEILRSCPLVQLDLGRIRPFPENLSKILTASKTLKILRWYNTYLGNIYHYFGDFGMRHIRDALVACDGRILIEIFDHADHQTMDYHFVDNLPEEIQCNLEATKLEVEKVRVKASKSLLWVDEIDEIMRLPYIRDLQSSYDSLTLV